MINNPFLITDPILLLFALVGCHFFFDFSGQGQFMSDAKNPTKPIPGISWRMVLFGHAAIHSAVVALLTGFPLLGAAELIIHFRVDKFKCENKITFTQDQFIHLGCKLAYCYITTIAYLFHK